MKIVFVFVNLNKHFRIPAFLGNSHRASTGAGGKWRYLLPSCFRFSQPVHHSNHTSCNGSFVVLTLRREFVFELLMIFGPAIAEVSEYFVKKTECKPKPRKWQRSLRVTEVYEYGLADKNGNALCFLRGTEE
jgi:hypothetical protein